MKKIALFVAMVVAILASYSMAFAYKNTILVDGKPFYYNVPDITIKVAGQNFDTGNTPPLILKDSTLIPVRVISEKGFGAKVEWDDKTKSVTITKDKTVRLTIGSDVALVDGKEVKLVAPARIIGIGNEGYTYIPFRFLFETFGYKVEWDQKNYQINAASPPKIANITSFTTSYNNGVFSVNITADSPIKYSQGVIEDPGNIRIYVDIENAIWDKGRIDIPINKKSLVNAVIAQNQTQPVPKVRAVIYLTDVVPYNITKSQDSTNLTISFDVGTSYVTGISFAKEGDYDKVIINCDAEQFNTQKVGDNKIVVDISDAILKMPDGSKAGQIPVQGNVITAIRYSQYNNDTVRVVADTTGKADYSVKILDKNIIMLVLKSQPNEMPLIYIDPGHGGSDPGAIGVGGLRESDVVLGIALKLNSLLTKGGFRTTMSRDSDVFIDLVTRSQEANNAGADVFISIHTNAFGTPTPKGTEIWYYPNGYKGDTRDNKTFAQIIHDNLMKEINTVDRGLKEGPNLSVLNKTKMPAILIETAFITNPDDAALLQDDAFQWKVAQGIYNGIVEYFKKLKEGSISATVSNSVYDTNNTNSNP
ncbi:N-acetylmuramoyl-L-alanine amidase [Thermoanaerobacter thermohydrosulfuricus]|uniref:N-acetylmuramoyl-L-alanine amidase n=2 Tax=Thermoanaerobacter thermohydrosulfuricus TaxID=1516 RepID=M8CU44_THETY|nr:MULTISPECIES: N-acetylmuramoyl-L-alanine amidase [Thermoanaerobacter]EMT37964.1 N-acetylmuramoyl-L-alanine amidase [Thermoanaerobacter thermohydrosulfuricus WC1]UZQ83610.1 N-acetylmuramoyl-L-alanine amidase family protein [Thermoanaerobacter sp. RKWS2]SDG02066.1 N-acetylmuramoyl-L-alanine amidase [Thermoanaerobacter thermohydrosulfuricus]SFE72415.1 N-acetylmuramoyl-L-alanine amidase [Thermoanaerobacter thermohydrosulfuricus]